MPDSKLDLSAKPISELVTHPDFPTSAIGERVDIKGYTGVITEVVRNSIKVRSDEGDMVSYNFHALRKIYSPRLAPEPSPTRETSASPVSSPVAKPEPKREIILAPNFDAPLVPIESLVHRPQFPTCALGLFVDLHGFAGVVVELLNGSLKVQPREGTIRSYNAGGLQRLYASAKITG